MPAAVLALAAVAFVACCSRAGAIHAHTATRTRANIDSSSLASVEFCPPPSSKSLAGSPRRADETPRSIVCRRRWRSSAFGWFIVRPMRDVRDEIDELELRDQHPRMSQWVAPLNEWFELVASLSLSPSAGVRARLEGEAASRWRQWSSSSSSSWPSVSSNNRLGWRQTNERTPSAFGTLCLVGCTTLATP